jgi:hypothetical protein
MSEEIELHKVVWLVWRTGWSFPDIVFKEEELGKYKQFSDITIKKYIQDAV